MRKAHKAYLVAALLMPLAAAACDSLEINPLPFTPVVNFERSYSDLTAQAGGAPTFATTAVKYEATLTGCSLSVGYANPVIYVAREFASNHCTRTMLLEHEQRHASAYSAALAKLGERIGAALADNELPQAISHALEAVEIEHRDIDTPAEYERLARACHGFIPATVRTLVR